MKRERKGRKVGLEETQTAMNLRNSQAGTEPDQVQGRLYQLQAQ